jgi:CheY-like chemotaxis protein
MAGTRILWVDDDAQGLLGAVASELRACGCVVETAFDVQEALQSLEAAKECQNEFASLLADIVLPRGRRNAGMARHLGISVAETAATKFGVQRLAFLSAIPFREVNTRIQALGGLQWRYFEKAKLLEKGFIGGLGDYLKVTCKVRK